MLGHWALSALAPTAGEGDSDLVTSDVESFRRQVIKPFVPEALLASAHRAVEHTRLLRENGGSVTQFHAWKVALRFAEAALRFSRASREDCSRRAD